MADPVMALFDDAVSAPCVTSVPAPNGENCRDDTVVALPLPDRNAMQPIARSADPAGVPDDPEDGDVLEAGVPA